VVQPGSLVEQWRVLRACVEADHIVIAQAANTGLTGGSTPYGAYDRGVVIVSTKRLRGIHLLRGGQQVLCLAGSTLDALERRLAPIGREPHSVLGSSCIGASVVGGVCNNSGGALVRRGPSYTEYALYARVGADGTVALHNHLGLRIAGDAESILDAVERGAFTDADVEVDDRAASASDYSSRIRAVDAETPARFNADPGLLFEASGSAGRVMVFAVRLDTFPKDKRTATFYIGTEDPAELTRLRRRILGTFRELPISGEYIHRNAFDVAEVYGKDVFLSIQYLGTVRLPMLFAAKAWIDAVAKRVGFLPAFFSDRLMQAASRLFPKHLPRRIRGYRDRYSHHLILKMGDGGIDEARALLAEMFPSASGDAFECTDEEGRKAFLHRFAVAGAAVRYRAIHADQVEDIIALDVALRRNDWDWMERLPDILSDSVLKSLYYGHFFCHVFHQDYIVTKGSDPVALEHGLLEMLSERGAECPAEHNVGHLYPAKPALAAHYRQLDPGNCLNPGIGQTSRRRHWR
jgi:D-lactate dehydrogenase